jgi:two-component system, chemotaxis family, chemotaxis protein CheY
MAPSYYLVSSLTHMVRVMIADDSIATRVLLKGIMQRGQHEIVDEASDGIEVIEKINRSKPDILLLDYSMPKKDGLSVIRKIKETNHSIRVVMITTSDDQKLIEDCVKAGAIAHITKPFETTTVLKAISYAI